ncbi:MAG: ABC-2 family transporter protein [Clostridia bacterium]|nr:ABC-2 family transporter protein [Clostridia bacterium]
MLQAVKNQLKITLKTIKYGLMREMLNKTSFIMNIVFMILNNASFIIQWIVIYTLKEDVGGYTFNQVLLLWAIAASTYGFSHFIFKKSYYLSDIITNGKLDSFLVQPKNVLISVITTDVEVSALGDILYGYIVLVLSGLTITKFLLFTLFSITGAIIITDIAVLLGSLSFWFGKSDMIADTGSSLMTNFATYPDGIFKGISRILLLTIIPVGLTSYFPVWIMTKFDISLTFIIIVVTFLLTSFTFFVFYRGLRRYSSSNLMISKI